MTKAEFGYAAKNQMTLDDQQRKEVVEMLKVINDHDDVRRVHTALA